MSGYFERAKKKLDLLRDRDDITILGIESSCDETACAVLRGVLRAKAEKKAKAHNLNVFYPPIKLCTDYGVMIAAQALCMIKAGREPAEYDLDANASIEADN